MPGAIGAWPGDPAAADEAGGGVGDEPDARLAQPLRQLGGRPRAGDRNGPAGRRQHDGAVEVEGAAKAARVGEQRAGAAAARDDRELDRVGSPS